MQTFMKMIWQYIDFVSKLDIKRELYQIISKYTSKDGAICGIAFKEKIRYTKLQNVLIEVQQTYLRLEINIIKYKGEDSADE